MGQKTQALTPLEQHQRFLSNADIKTTQIYAETSLDQVAESYSRVLGRNG
jgi:integrase/recombinase XerD